MNALMCQQKEQMSICLRFVDESISSHPVVREEFLGFVELDNITARFYC